MSNFHIAHLMALSAWGGLVLGEVTMELAGRRDEALQRAVARFHHAIDMWAEAPLLLLVLLTGGLLLFMRQNVDAWLVVKVALGLTAVAANGACFLLVVRRGRAAAGPTAVLDVRSRRIYATVVVGVPAGLAALVLGALRAGWL